MWRRGTGLVTLLWRERFSFLICTRTPLTFGVSHGAVANRRAPNLALLGLRGGLFRRADRDLAASGQIASYQQRAFVAQAFLLRSRIDVERGALNLGPLGLEWVLFPCLLLGLPRSRRDTQGAPGPLNKLIY